MQWCEQVVVNAYRAIIIAKYAINFATNIGIKWCLYVIFTLLDSIVKMLDTLLCEKRFSQ